MEYKLTHSVHEIIVYYSVGNPFLKFAHHVKALFIGFNKIQELVHRKKIDITHLNVMLPLGWFAYYLKLIKGVPYIITEHHSKYLKISKQKLSWHEKLMVKVFVKNASYVCPVSNYLKNEMIEKGFSGNYKVVPNVVNESIFNFSEKVENERYQILHVSSLDNAIKNVFGIIDAYKELIVQTKKSLQLHIIGDGDKQKVIDYALSVGLEKDDFRVEGPKIYKEIATAMKKSDVFVLFSNYENLPVVISESLMSGLPVIASNVGGISEMISSQNGVLINPKNHQGLTKVMLEFVENKYDFNHKLMADKAKEIYGFEVVGKTFFEIYKSIN
jgi:glycosyltransferase involved in cell wall biosynthesis